MKNKKTVDGNKKYPYLIYHNSCIYSVKLSFFTSFIFYPIKRQEGRLFFDGRIIIIFNI